jgi:AcrR family transcriptional regulator
MGKPRMKGPERRARILDAALEVFAAKGYQATVLGDIAKAAGVTRSVLYDHFPNKRVLLLTVMQDRNAALLEYVGSRITGQGSAEDRMRATIEAYFSFAEQFPQARRLLFDRIDEDDAEIRTVRWGIREARTRAVMVLLAPDVRKLGLEPEAPATEATVELLIAGLDGMAQWWERHKDVPREDLVTTAMQVLWTGLGPLTDAASLTDTNVG